MPDARPPAAHALILGARARAFRRELGAVAWSVLEDVATDAVSGVAVTSARRVAANLGIGKDAAARALALLVDARLLFRVGQERGSGRFSSGSYELRLPPGLLVPCPVVEDTEGDQADRRAVGRSQGGRRRGRQGPPDDTSPGSAAPSLDRPSRRGQQRPDGGRGQLDLFGGSCEDESKEDSRAVASQDHSSSRLLHNHQLTAQSLIDQSPQRIAPAFRNQAPRQQTRLHRGCDDVAADAPAASPPEAGGKPC